jgi:hypothetical protein
MTQAEPAGALSLPDWLADPARPRLLNVATAGGLPQTLQVTVERAGDGYLLFGQVNAREQERLRRHVLALNHKLSISSRELRRLNALKNQFLGMAAPDLRKPAGRVFVESEPRSGAQFGCILSMNGGS